MTSIYVASAFVCAGGRPGWSGLRLATAHFRKGVARLDHIVWGLVFFSLAMAISLRKAGLRPGTAIMSLVSITRTPIGGRHGGPLGSGNDVLDDRPVYAGRRPPRAFGQTQSAGQDCPGTSPSYPGGFWMRTSPSSTASPGPTTNSRRTWGPSPTAPAVRSMMR